MMLSPVLLVLRVLFHFGLVWSILPENGSFRNAGTITHNSTSLVLGTELAPV